MLKPWDMNWTSCLVRTHPEGEQGLDHMRLGHRIEVINEGFFHPQARAIVGRNDPDRINRIVKDLRLKARTSPPAERITLRAGPAVRDESGRIIGCKGLAISRSQMLIPCSSALFIQGAWAGFSFPTPMIFFSQQ